MKAISPNTKRYAKCKTDLQNAIEVGLNSGVVEDFNPAAYLQQMKERKSLGATDKVNY